MKRLIAPDRASLITVVILGVLYSSPSHAYIDPGTGSIILQGLLASLAVGIGVLRRYWQQFKDYFAGFKGDSRKFGDVGRDDFEQTSNSQTKT